MDNELFFSMLLVKGLRSFFTPALAVIEHIMPIKMMMNINAIRTSASLISTKGVFLVLIFVAFNIVKIA